MATATKKQVLTQQQFGGVPYGNKTGLIYRLATNASGVWTDSDQTTAVASGDKLRLGVLPAGLLLVDCLAIISDLFTASVTGALGFEYVDGVDSTAVPQDADYFFAALAFSATGRTRANNLAVAPVRLPKDAYLILTTGGANIAAAGVADFVIEGILTGAT